MDPTAKSVNGCTDDAVAVNRGRRDAGLEDDSVAGTTQEQQVNVKNLQKLNEETSCEKDNWMNLRRGDNVGI